MSVQYFCDSVGKWVKDLPGVSKLVDDVFFLNRYWDVAHNSWRKASSDISDVLLQLSVLLYRLMKEQQRYLSHIGIDFSRANEKLFGFIKECLLGEKDARCLDRLTEYEDVGELFKAFASMLRKLSTLYILKNEGDGNFYFAYSNAWAFVKVSHSSFTLSIYFNSYIDYKTLVQWENVNYVSIQRYHEIASWTLPSAMAVIMFSLVNI